MKVSEGSMTTWVYRIISLFLRASVVVLRGKQGHSRHNLLSKSSAKISE